MTISIDVPVIPGDVVYAGYEKNKRIEHPIAVRVESVEFSMDENSVCCHKIYAINECTGCHYELVPRNFGKKWWLTFEDAEKALGDFETREEKQAIRAEMSKLRKRLAELDKKEKGE